MRVTRDARESQVDRLLRLFPNSKFEVKTNERGDIIEYETEDQAIIDFITNLPNIRQQLTTIEANLLQDQIDMLLAEIDLLHAGFWQRFRIRLGI